MVLLPDFLDFGGGLSLDHGHLHDLPQLPRTGVGEGHGVDDSLQHVCLLNKMRGYH
jgi:hypothetical protein